MTMKSLSPGAILQGTPTKHERICLIMAHFCIFVIFERTWVKNPPNASVPSWNTFQKSPPREALPKPAVPSCKPKKEGPNTTTTEA